MSNFNLNASYGSAVGAALTAQTTGNSFYVASASYPNWNTLNSIFVPDSLGIQRSFNTISAALAASTANNGDVIYVAPGYTETIVGAAGDTFNVAGVSIVGLGNGTNRPTFTFTTSTAAQILVTGANVTFTNLIFTAGIDAIVAMVKTTALNTSFQNCLFNTNSGTVGAVLGILTGATANGLVVNNCRFVGPAVNTGTTTTAQIQYEAATDVVITNNYFTGKMTQAILNTSTVLRGSIDNNRFVIATGTSAITVAAASTPFITNNRINVPSGTTPITAAAGFVAGNVYSAAAGVTAGTASTF